jgi:Do/DeqQ family serine protease
MKKSFAFYLSAALLLTLLLNIFISRQLFQEYKSELEASIMQPRSEMVTYKGMPINQPPGENRVSSTPTDFVETARLAKDAVVNISVRNGSAFSASSSGSGIIISSDGYIITNNHVIASGEEIEVTLPNKHSYKARLVGKDPTTDLALLKIEAYGLPTISYGNSDDVQVGEWVLAIGNPYNLSSTVTAGIVSAKGRDINILNSLYAIESFIQTDAVVNPGNSGGALVNIEGELIGVNSAIMSESGGYEGYSFAIPSNLVKKVIDDLKTYGEVQRAVLGVTILNVNDEIAKDFRLPSVEGVFIRDIIENSSAHKAGLRINDVIVGINGRKTASVPELQEQMAQFRPGDVVSLQVMRNGKRMLIDNVRLQRKDGVNIGSR